MFAVFGFWLESRFKSQSCALSMIRIASLSASFSGELPDTAAWLLLCDVAPVGIV